MGIRINFGRTGRGLLPPLCSAPTAKPQLITERWALLKVWRPNSTTTQFMTTKHNVLLLSECGQRWKAPSRFQTLEVREHEPSHRYCKKMVVGWSPCIICWKSNTLQISDIISPQDLTRKIHYILNSEKILEKGTGNIIVKLVTYSWFPVVRYCLISVIKKKDHTEEQEKQNCI